MVVSRRQLQAFYDCEEADLREIVSAIKVHLLALLQSW